MSGERLQDHWFSFHSYLKETIKSTVSSCNSISYHFRHFDSFKDGCSKLNNYPTMTIGKFILVLSDQFKLRFISKLFFLRFRMKIKYKIELQVLTVDFFISLRYE